MRKHKLFIGTSGWVYDHWDGIFYPKDLSSKDKLKYFSKHFKTAEINYSFYHLPRPGTYKKWHSETPGDFLFAVKASRYITHIKRLKEVKEAWKQFKDNALNLKKKLGPILFQFPASFKAKETEVKRVEDFLRMITKDKLRYAFEFRHKSWCDKKIYNLLKKYKAAWVIADSPRYPRSDEVTANFVYIRMHGSKEMFSSSYTKKELKDLAEKIRKWQKGSDVFLYFNNDVGGYAVKNARELLKICK